MLSRVPLLWFAISFITGISLNIYLPINQIIIPLSAILFLTIIITTLSYVKSKHTVKNKSITTNCLILSLCIGFIIAGILRHNTQNNELIQPTALLKQKIKSVKFKILEPSDLFLKGTKSGKWQVIASIISINNIQPEKYTKVILTGKGNATLHNSDIIKAKHILVLKPKPSSFPNGFSNSRHMYTQDVTTNIKILGKYTIHHSNTPSILSVIDRIRAYAIQNTLKYARYQTQGFLAATIFGYRDAINVHLKNSFRRTGIGHILAISGLHVGLIILIINYICKLFQFSPRSRSVITIIACIIFLGLSGGRSTVLRASIVAFIYLGGILIFRKSNFINSLGAAALIICIINPLQVFDIGFQMSFISVIFISMLGQKFIPYIQPLKPEYLFQRRHIQYFLKSLPYNISILTVVTISAWLGILPLTTYYFKEVSLISFLTNLLIIPLMPLAISGGILLQLTPLLPYKLTAVFTGICSFPANAILKIINSISHLPITSMKVFPPSKEIILLYYLLFIIFFIYPLVFKKAIKPLFIILSISITVLIFALFYFGNNESTTTTASIALLRNKTSESVIIQGNSNSDKINKTNSKTNNNYTILLLQSTSYPTEIIDYLYSKRIRTIDVVYFVTNNQEFPLDYCQWLKIKKIEFVSKTEKEVTSKLKPNNDININITRSNTGRIVWYNIINQKINILITTWHKESVYNEFLKSKQTGYNSPFKLLRINGKKPLDKYPAKYHSEYIIRDKDIYNNPGRKNYGLIFITSKKIEAWNGVKFTLLKKYHLQADHPAYQ